jgi:hypothetical protein
MMKPQSGHGIAVAEIAEALKPWRRPWHKEGVLFEIRAQIDLVQSDLDLTSREAITKFRDDAKDIIKLIDRLKLRLSKARFIWWSHSPAIPAFERLDDLRDICESFAEPKRLDMVQALCAGTADYLIRVISTKGPTNSSDRSPFRVIAKELYMIVGPTRKNADRSSLSRACARALREGNEQKEEYWEELRRTAALAQLEAKKSS